MRKKNEIVVLKKDEGSLFKIKPEHSKELGKAIEKSDVIIKELINALKDSIEESNPLRLNVKEIKPRNCLLLYPLGNET